MGALITTYRDRPAVIKVKGWTIYVSIKDDHYIREKKKWREKLISLHPDKTHKSGYQFRQAMLKYIAWRNQQVREYEAIGLTPPDRARKVSTYKLPTNTKSLMEACRE